MNSFLNLFIKEVNLLRRDLFGLSVLFLMPAVLLIVITCIQTANFKKIDQSFINMIVVNNDKSINIQRFKSSLNNNGLKIIQSINGNIITLNSGKALLDSSDYIAMLVIPPNMKQTIEGYIKKELTDESPTLDPPEIKMELILNKNINPLLAKSLRNGLKNAVKNFEFVSVEDAVRKKQGYNNIPVSKILNVSWVKTDYQFKGNQNKQPNPIQQNVPAWALFGMFFIVIPLSATFINEKKSSVMKRLLVTPMKPYTFLLSKVIAYVIINMVQLYIMIFIGMYILPLLGTQALNMTGCFWGMTVVGFISALAATGFGLVIGSVLKSFHQASMFGPVIIVIFAAIGGIMVPTFLMPQNIRAFSQYSPLYWGHKAFIDVLVRNEGILDIYLPLMKLIIFFIVCFVISWIYFKKNILSIDNKL